MIKLISVSLLLLTLTACTNASTSDASHNFILPEDLKDCTIIALKSEGHVPTQLHLIKCPEGYIGTSTTYPVGKTRTTSSVFII